MTKTDSATDWPRILAFVVAGVAALVGGFQYLVLPRQGERHAREVSNCADMTDYAEQVGVYRTKHGRYPSSLIDAIDAQKRPRLAGLTDRYGTAIRYESNGSEFVLVSYGSDAKPETTNYWPYRTQSVMSRTLEDERRQCAAGADVVFTDQGCYRCCGN